MPSIITECDIMAASRQWGIMQWGGCVCCHVKVRVCGCVSSSAAVRHTSRQPAAGCMCVCAVSMYLQIMGVSDAVGACITSALRQQGSCGGMYAAGDCVASLR